MRPTAEKLLQNARHFWPIYKTEEIIDYLDASAPVVIDRAGKKISNRPSNLPVNIDAVKGLVVGYLMKGETDIPTNQLSAMLARDYGLDLKKEVIGRILKGLGASKTQTKAGTFYNISKVQVVYKNESVLFLTWRIAALISLFLTAPEVRLSI